MKFLGILQIVQLFWKPDSSLNVLFWKTEYKKEPVAFGVWKLVMGCTVEDEKVSVDDLIETIQSYEDNVQSVDIVAFNKL